MSSNPVQDEVLSYYYTIQPRLETARVEYVVTEWQTVATGQHAVPRSCSSITSIKTEQLALEWVEKMRNARIQFTQMKHKYGGMIL